MTKQKLENKLKTLEISAFLYQVCGCERCRKLKEGVLEEYRPLRIKFDGYDIGVKE